MADQFSSQRQEGVAERYLVRCPDVLDLEVAGRPELTGRRPVGLDGRIDLGSYGRPRVEGKALPQIVLLLAEETGRRPEDLRVRVADYQSQHIYLFGQVIGWQRAVPYQGQETVLAVLQRVGGITPGAAPDDVYVVRPHIQAGKRPEVFHVDLAAIVVKHDPRTNIRLQPDDQIYVGETRQARIEKCIPPWLRPVYQALWDTQPQKGERGAWSAERAPSPLGTSPSALPTGRATDPKVVPASFAPKRPRTFVQ